MTTTRKLILLFIVLESLLQDGVVVPIYFEETHVTVLSNLQGYLFEDKVLFDQSSLSPVHCAHACLLTPDCVMVTTTALAVGQVSRCRGHSAIMRKGNDASQHVPGAHAFMLKERVEALTWLNRSCVLDSSCPAELSECFSSRCLCSPGYYYSVSKDTCVDGCSKGQLQPYFLTYPGSLLLAQGGVSRRVSSVQRCLSLCRADRHCRSFDLDHGECATHYSTARDNPNDFHTALGSSTWHFQRMCA